MVNIEEIMDMLDWNQPIEIQKQGIALAKSINTIVPFIQPLTPKYSKNVWDNCALVISCENDEVLKPHLSELLEWLQDMNWPGAYRIHDRLLEYSDNDSISSAIRDCIKKAKNSADNPWKEVLEDFWNEYCQNLNK